MIPCTDYQIQLDTFSHSGLSNRTSVAERTTLANIQLDEFRYSLLEDNSIRFNWTRLRDIERCDGDYFVKLFPLDEAYPTIVGDHHHTPYNTNEVIVAGLRPCMRMNVTLNANYFDKVATLSEVTTPFAKPSQISGLKLTENGTLLEWNPPVENPYCMANYTVTVNGSEKSTTATNAFQLDNLERCENYSISISPKDKNGGEYDPLEIHFEMTVDVVRFTLEPLYSLHAENQTLFISWENPVFRRKCGIQFDLTWNGDRLEETSQNFYVIDDLEFCKSNEVEIRISYGNESTVYQNEVSFGANCM